ncbi:unnamed protein product [Sphagnum jensenii]|uniref:Uncharacterized protein n=1 Tax=Sphagnum jensenii TaxID=128206 RepID=A0ABP1B4V8_9BRYO
MAQQTGKGWCSMFLIRVAMLALALGFSVYSLGPSLYWHFVGEEGALVGWSGACQPCFCDCTHSSDLLTTMPISDCIKDDPQMQKELDKSQIQLLKEELKLQEEVNKEAQQRAELAYLDAKKISSQYQKEAEKCNTGMETSEEARERAEAELVVERKRTVLWERRARAMGWKGKDDPEVVSWEPIGKS